MAASLQSRVEDFLNEASIISFAYRSKPAIISFLFEKEKIHIFQQKKNHEDLRNFFRGRKLKLMIFTPESGNTEVSLVDTSTADSILLNNPKFVHNNIILFSEAKLPENTIFAVSLMCAARTKDNEKTIVLHEYWADKKQLEIHGYSLIDKRI